MITYFAILTLFYGSFTLLLYRSWLGTRNMRTDGIAAPLSDFTKVSVIIPVRNEAENLPLLLHDLQQQTYPHHAFEVIIIDDNSTDQTAALACAFNASYTLFVLPLQQLEAGMVAYKKRAITQGIQASTGELIVTTDGDCRVGTAWIQTLVAHYQTADAAFISAPVTFYAEQSLFERMQTIEFASLVGSGGACMYAGFPNMCNGANLAYPKRIFEEVGGFEGKDHLASGDDEFMMHKIAARYPGRLVFVNHPQALVQTKAKPDWHSFYLQRKRWASKWKSYSDKRVSLLAAFIFTYHTSMAVYLLATLLGMANWTNFLFFFAIKFGLEYGLISAIFKDFGKKTPIGVFFILQLIYGFYVAFFGLAGNFVKGYEWKGRNVR